MTEEQTETRKSEITPRKRPRQKRSAAMVDRILDAALRLIQAGSVDALTTVAICRSAGLSVGSLYQYFPNRDAILLELAQRWLAAFEAPLASRQKTVVRRDGTSLAAELHALLAELGDLYRSHAQLLPIVDAMYHKPELERIVHEQDRIIVRLHADWLKSFSPSLDDRTALHLGAMMQASGHGCLSIAATLPSADYARVLADVHRMHLALLAPHLT